MPGPDLFDGVIDSLGKGVADQQAANMAKGLVKAGLLDPEDVAPMTAGILLGIKALFRNLAKGQST